jgi:hypothetical protein
VMRKRVFGSRAGLSLLLLVSAAAAAAVLVVGAGAAGAAVTTVNCPPFGVDSLQAAITAAAPGDTLSIRGTCTGNFTVAQNLTLQGVASGATLNGGGAGTTLSISGGAIVTVRALTITGGSATDGGGINVGVATLNLVNSTVTGNAATGFGGGIETGGSLLNLVGSTVSHNTADDGAGIDVFNSEASLTASTVTLNAASFVGGGIENEDATFPSLLSLSSSTVSWNTAGSVAGGIDNFGSTATLTNSSVDHNRASYGGGGIANVSGLVDGGASPFAGVAHHRSGPPIGFQPLPGTGDASLTIDGSTVSFNSVTGPTLAFSGGGGIANVGEEGTTASLVATSTTFRGNLAKNNSGGGLYNLNFFGGAAALATLAQSPLSQAPDYLNQNQAQLGGGIANDGTAGLASLSLQPGAHVVHNQASVDGGGLYNTGASGDFLITGAVLFLNSPDNISDESPGGNS